MSKVQKIINVLFGNEETQSVPKNKTYTSEAEYGIAYPIITKRWDGEKTPGELGVVIKNMPDYKRIRLRAYDAEMKIDSINIITGRYFKWVIGSGLKLQSEPNKTVLQLEGVNQDLSTFPKNVEARFSIYANSKYADYSRQKNLHDLALECFSTSFLGGDCLVVCRIDNFGVNVQVIDGQHVCTPSMEYSNLLDEVDKRGNYEQNGIEFNSRGEHISYFVNIKGKDNTIKVERILAKGEKTNRTLAWMVYGTKHRIDHTRGISRISHILEKINKLDRYTEASVSKAEQGANIVFTIEHDENSTGEDPLKQIANRKLRLTELNETTDTPQVLADGLANRITETTSNQTFNLPNGAKLVPYQSNGGNDFEVFYKAVFSGICASIGMPPEVAMQQYNSNYSASRAAINGWGYIVDIDRKKIADDFYKPIYALWLEFQVLSNKITANGFIEALKSDNYMVTDSYKNCRFIGKNMPHIDPVKEVKAISEMLDKDLITREQATENLNMGDWNENFLKKQEEDKLIPKPIVQDGNATK